MMIIKDTNYCKPIQTILKENPDLKYYIFCILEVDLKHQTHLNQIL
jgi:hypothetical protein